MDDTLGEVPRGRHLRPALESDDYIFPAIGANGSSKLGNTYLTTTSRSGSQNLRLELTCLTPMGHSRPIASVEEELNIDSSLHPLGNDGLFGSWLKGVNKPLAMKHHNRKVIAVEFISRYSRNTADFLEAYPEANDGSSKLLQAINKAWAARGDRVTRK
ncbi:hypothetical protein K438DRAFT_1777042 [Mycena galopus ATCC 62051]|nr:hypothetical protein K438DRAFT_1777042 [Mycena galopus ATCC 62051]